MRTAPSLLLLLLLLAASLPAQGNDGDLLWPFGAPKNGGMMQRLDLFNLGLIGAKAYDADGPEPQPRMGAGRGGGRIQRPKHEDGPSRLKIKALLPGGPGHRADLELGDVVVGVNQRTFEKGYVPVLAAAILAAESKPRKNTLTLQVERGGKQLNVVVKIPKGGTEASKPITGKGRDRILKQGLKWLVDRQLGSGGYPQTTGANTGAVVQTCMAGLAWVAGGSSLGKGRHRKQLDLATTFVLEGLDAKSPFAGRGTRGNWNQTTWAYAHAAIFLGEMYQAKKSGRIKASLQKLADELCRRQEASGGYAHGPGGKNALNYLELNIMAGFVLSGIGLAEQAGCKVDRKVVDGLVAYLEKSSVQGGIGYSATNRGRGNIGRTAGAWLGCLTLGLRKQGFVRKMQSFTEKNIDNVFGGHASLMQHILLAGLAARSLGGKAETAYWKRMQRELVIARAPDGSFQARPWAETMSLGLNSDVNVGEVWTTACWLVVLGANGSGKKKGGLPGWLGRTRK